MKQGMRPMLQDKSLMAPVSLARAAEMLQAQFPEYAFTVNQLRKMCMNRSVPYMEIPRGGRFRTVTWVVRVADLVSAFKAMEIG